MKKKSGHRRRTKVVRRSRKNLRRTVKRKSVGKGRRRPTRRYSRVQRGGNRFTDNLNCFVTVGDNYYYGDNKLGRDYDMAFKLYTVAAENKNAEARFKLGRMYEHGQGVAMDYAEAARLFHFAAAEGNMSTDTLEKRTSLIDNLNCFVTVGDIYYYGDGYLDRDDDMAVKLYTVAAENKKARGQFRLGEMYRRGKGVVKNEVEAVRLYQLAAAQGDADAVSMLTRLT